MSLTENEIQLLTSAIARLTSLGSIERLKELTVVVGLVAQHDYTVNRLGEYVILTPPAAKSMPEPQDALCASTTPICHERGAK